VVVHAAGSLESAPTRGQSRHARLSASWAASAAASRSSVVRKHSRVSLGAVCSKNSANSICWFNPRRPHPIDIAWSARIRPTRGVNLKPWPLHAEPITTGPMRSSTKSWVGVVV
jgi:hypothetical protein